MKYFIIALLFFAACSKSKTDLYQEVYTVEMIGTWSETTHPTDFPENAHFSPMIGLSHIEGLDVISEGLTATEGIKSMAETGKTDTLDKEFLKFHNQTYSLDRVIGEGFSSPGSKKVEIGVERGRHKVSFFSMIAPSPDWFVAVSTSLIDPVDGKWYDVVTVHATSYDAGTDSGTSFTSTNAETLPVEGVHEIINGPLTEGADSVINMVKFVFTRVVK